RFLAGFAPGNRIAVSAKPEGVARLKTRKGFQVLTFSQNRGQRRKTKGFAVGFADCPGRFKESSGAPPN
ncbi:MAG: hypothetical protein IJ074_04750, partial [Clostridia bacterium]|nr:hypothetical protein [Clostridia bacterium]